MQDLAGQILRDFVSLLDIRFAGNVFTTEDSVRYTFYAALLKNGVSPDRVITECNHPAIKDAEIDTVILQNDDTPSVAAIAVKVKAYLSPFFDSSPLPTERVIKLKACPDDRT